MKGVILAGGTGSRLFPLTKVTNKHLLPVGNKPMIFYPLEKLVEAGIEDILIITGTEHIGDFMELLGSGRVYGANLTYKVQDESGGIAQALALAEAFANGEKIVVILGDNVFDDDLFEIVELFERQASGALVLVKEVEDPKRFGVVEFDDKLKLLGIEEKPENPKSNFIITGIYFYDQRVFEIIKTLEPSERGELEISDVNKVYLEKGLLQCAPLMNYWTDAGTFKSLHKANQLVRGEK